MKRLAQPGIPSEDAPEIDFTKVINGIVRVGLKPVPPKEAISLRVDADVLAWYKAQGEGYQTKMNAVLKAFRDASIQEPVFIRQGVNGRKRLVA